jgi:nucleoside 2-deoxyribosyltransferase
VPQVDDPLPTPTEQADNLILWLRDHQRSPAQQIEICEPEVSAWIGTAITPDNSDGGLAWLLRQPQMKLFVENNASYNGPDRLSLTFEGWQRYEALKHAQVESRTAFMAMQFDSEMDRVVKDCFKPAVARTGFELRVLTDGQPAGLIDDQLRVALRIARFVIADLTHDNNGAYWEAGFAEGLGRPVIYTCRKQKWDANKSHFDTSHLNTIIWDAENLGDAATRLTATIRATLPAEAKMAY